MNKDWPDIAGRIEGAAHVLPVRVYFEDTDFTGVVYYANYLKFAERGRSDFLRLIDVHHTELAAENLAFAVRHIEADYLRPARIDDIVLVTTKVAEMRGARFMLDQSISRDGETLFTAR
ncbi:MAG: 4-hydroxybenzoyl-CoA thioesterase, partial [Hyphomicrobiales bacterium]